MRRWLALAVFGGFCAASATGSAFAGGGGGGGFPPTPGVFHSTDSSAFASLNTPAGAPFVTVNVDRGSLKFKLRKTSGPPIVVQNGTMLNVFVDTGNGVFAQGCWIIPDTAFVVAGDLSSASVSGNVPAQSNCPGFALSGQPGGGPLQSLGGGGGGPSGFGSDVAISVNWTSSGAVTTSHFSANTRCQDFGDTAQADNSSAFANTTGTISTTIITPQGPLPVISTLVGPLPFEIGQISQTTNNENVRGTLSTACNPFVVG